LSYFFSFGLDLLRESSGLVAKNVPAITKILIPAMQMLSEK